MVLARLRLTFLHIGLLSPILLSTHICPVSVLKRGTQPTSDPKDKPRILEYVVLFLNILLALNLNRPTTARKGASKSGCWRMRFLSYTKLALTPCNSLPQFARGEDLRPVSASGGDFVLSQSR